MSIYTTGYSTLIINVFDSIHTSIHKLLAGSQHTWDLPHTPSFSVKHQIFFYYKYQSYFTILCLDDCYPCNMHGVPDSRKSFLIPCYAPRPALRISELHCFSQFGYNKTKHLSHIPLFLVNFILKQTRLYKQMIQRSNIICIPVVDNILQSNYPLG